MPFVLDASVAAGWAFEDEDHPTATLALERIRSNQARVPSLCNEARTYRIEIAALPGDGAS